MVDVVVCSVCETDYGFWWALAHWCCEQRTLHAATNIHAETSTLVSSVINTEHLSRTGSLSLRKIIPQSSATALCTSGLHLVNTGWKALQVSSTASKGIMTYLMNDEKVSRSTVRVGAERERGKRFRSGWRISLKRGARVIRRSCDNCWRRLHRMIRMNRQNRNQIDTLQ